MSSVIVVRDYKAMDIAEIFHRNNSCYGGAGVGVVGGGVKIHSWLHVFLCEQFS